MFDRMILSRPLELVRAIHKTSYLDESQDVVKFYLAGILFD
jgi:hypothetical protein